MNEIDFNKKVASDIHTNRLMLNGVNVGENHPEYDFDWFVLDESVLDGNDLLM